MAGDRFKGILSMTGVNFDTLNIPGNKKNRFYDTYGLYFLKCNNVDKINVCCHTHIHFDYLYCING